MTANQIEQQIESLPPVEQIKMLERIVCHLKQLLLTQSTATTPVTGCKGIAGKLNQVYKAEPPHMDQRLFSAQLTSIGRDEWS